MQKYTLPAKAGFTATQAMIHVPEGNEPFPLIIFLHGTAEKGTDINEVTLYGPLYYVKNNIDLGFEFIGIHPQLPNGDENQWSVDDVESWWNYAKDNFSVDESRVVLMGVSLGGRGNWNFLNHSVKAYRLAGAALMSPGDPEPDSINAPNAPGRFVLDISRMAAINVPMWISHAPNDTTTTARPSVSRDNFKRINNKAKENRVLYTEFGLSGHSTGSAWGKFMTPQNYFFWEWVKNLKKNQ